MSTATTTIARRSPDAPEAAALIAQAEEELARNYPPEHRHGLAVDALLAQRARFFVATIDGVAMGCAGYVVFPDGTAELKRMFVAPAARGTGLARALLTAIEREAAAEGVATLYLETGTLQHAALALYRRAGFLELGPFAAYQASPVSIFMEKPL